MNDCLFCKIIDGKIPADLVYQDDQVIAFNDINPQAPVHMLVVPRKHIATLNDVTNNNEPLVGHLVKVAAQLAKDNNLQKDGYRTVMNCNEHGGQTVFHIHLHLLGGRQLQWPPG